MDGAWILWTQGSAPIEFANPFVNERGAAIQLDNTGNNFLVRRDLQPVGPNIQCEVWAKCPDMPPPKPQNRIFTGTAQYQNRQNHLVTAGDGLSLLERSQSGDQ
ncbi:MAG TPA: hypothetical protein VF509_09605 [Sphingobium sp.]